MPLRSASELDVFTFPCSSSIVCSFTSSALATVVKMSDDPTQQVELVQISAVYSGKRQRQAGSSGDKDDSKRQRPAGSSGDKDMPETETASSDNDMQETAGSSGDNDMQETAGTSSKIFNCWQSVTVCETAPGKVAVLQHHQNFISLEHSVAPDPPPGTGWTQYRCKDGDFWWYHYRGILGQWWCKEGSAKVLPYDTSSEESSEID